LVSIKYISSFLWISEIYITHKKQESGELFDMKHGKVVFYTINWKFETKIFACSFPYICIVFCYEQMSYDALTSGWL
jgi:hypothetical protein